MSLLHDKRFPQESPEYRSARNELLQAEIALRAQIEAVANKRRALPLGGPLKEDYAFTERSANGSETVTPLSKLFAENQDTLLLYHWMYGPDWKASCPMCNSLLDGLNGNARHLRKKISFAVVAKAPVETLNKWAEGRGWNHLRVLSHSNTSFAKDYNAEWKGDYGDLHPILNVFVKRDGVIRHFWASEMYFVKPEEGQHMRHADLLWSLWHALDLTPAGRGTDWLPTAD